MHAFVAAWSGWKQGAKCEKAAKTKKKMMASGNSGAIIFGDFWAFLGEIVV